jgi:hypothetical protein
MKCVSNREQTSVSLPSILMLQSEGLTQNPGLYPGMISLFFTAPRKQPVTANNGDRKEGDELQKIKVMEYMCGFSALIVGLGFYSYYVRELLASLALFTGAFFLLGAAIAGAFLLWCAGVQAIVWFRPASRNMIAISRRLIAAYARA